MRHTYSKFPPNFAQWNIKVFAEAVPGPPRMLAKASGDCARYDEGRLKNAQEHLGQRQLLIDLPGFMQLIALKHAYPAGRSKYAGQFHNRLFMQRSSAAIDDVNGVMTPEKFLRRQRHAAALQEIRICAVILGQTLRQCQPGAL